MTHHSVVSGSLLRRVASFFICLMIFLAAVACDVHTRYRLPDEKLQGTHGNRIALGPQQAVVGSDFEASVLKSGVTYFHGKLHNLTTDTLSFFPDSLVVWGDSARLMSIDLRVSGGKKTSTGSLQIAPGSSLTVQYSGHSSAIVYPPTIVNVDFGLVTDAKSGHVHRLGMVRLVPKT